jgi:hypothetical protein
MKQTSTNQYKPHSRLSIQPQNTHITFKQQKTMNKMF